jgi:hypothetical protein
MRLLKNLKVSFLPSALIFHISLILARGYFLSPEFTLYPYLVSRGFLPYRDIIDQHFPSLLFGPFSLPSFLTVNPWPLLALFLLTLCLTDIFLYASLYRFKVKKPLVWLILFILTSVYFSGNILWIETFVNLLLAVWLFLSFSKNNLRRFVSGFLLSQIILLRPTFTPALLILLFSFSGLSWSLFFGGLSGLAIPALFILKQEIFTDFYRLTIQFNQSVYPKEASLLPGKRQIFFLLVWVAPLVSQIIKYKKYLYFGVIALSVLLLFPRFGYEHLQPVFLIGVLFWSLLQKKPGIIVYSFIFCLFLLNLISAIRHPYGNFYLTPDIHKAVQEIKEIPGIEIYLLGAPDILYQLSDKIPPNYTYVPSLPWYLSQEDFVDKIILSLEKSKSFVLVDFESEIDGKNIALESGRVLEYIRINYIGVDKIGNYQLFLPKP